MIYGGACHATRPEASSGEDDGTHVPYGDFVVDLDEILVLDLASKVWLPTNKGYWPLRGGVNGIAALDDGSILIQGGMHSDPGAEMPTWKSGLVVLDLDLD